MKFDPIDGELSLDYPCRWGYKVIGRDEEELRAAVAEVVGDRDYTVELSRTSSKGRYCSLDVELEVRDEEERVGIFKELGEHPATEIVL